MPNDAPIGGGQSGHPRSHGHCVHPRSHDRWIVRRVDRRRLISAGLAAGIATGFNVRAEALADDETASSPKSERNQPAQTAPLETFVPVRQITRGPKYHWFGYYDKHEFSHDDALVLSNEIAFEHREPRPDDSIGVGYVDTRNGDRWVPLGQSSAWGWQQGCMLQFIPQTERRNDVDGASANIPSKRRVIWNDQRGDKFVSHIVDLDRPDPRRTLDRPIYTLSPDGRTALTLDFSRLDNLRPGYGYDGASDPHVDDAAPKDSGIWSIDLMTGQSRLILSLADVAAIPWSDDVGGKRSVPATAWHYFNHLLINPAGDRFIALHRYRPKFDPATLTYDGGFVTRMITADMDGSNVRVLDPSGHTSHFIWDDDRHVTMWTRPADRPWGFYRFTDPPPANGRVVQPVGRGVMPANGHNTYLPAPYDDWILNDTYPRRGNAGKPDRRQTVYLFHEPSGRRFDLGHFPSPPSYTGQWRCDTHPRSSRDGRTVAIDSPHNGGRQVYLLSIGDILDQHA